MFENRSISFDFVISLVACVIYASIAFFVFHIIEPFSFLDNPAIINISINIFVAMLSAIVVIVSFFTIFESSFNENKAIRILKTRGQYQQIYSRYTDSIFVIFFGVILLCIAYLMCNQDFGFYIMTFIFGVVMLINILCLIRIYRCFALFRLLKNAIDVNQPSP